MNLFPTLDLFILFAALLTALALAVLLWPWRRARAVAAPDVREANLVILRQQRAELEAERQSGLLDDAQYRQALEELERRVLEEAKASAVPLRSGALSRATTIALLLLLPAGAAALYWKLGVPEALAPQETVSPHFSPDQVEQMVAELAERMRDKPDDPRGWAILARTYYAMQRYAEAAQAFEQLLQRTAPTAELLADYADALAMSRGRDLSGPPRAALERALALEPTHIKTLALLGAEAYERKDYPTALRYWRKLQPLAPPDSELGMQVASSIAEAEVRSGKSASKPVVKPVGPSVSGKVALSAQVKDVPPEATVFVFARPAEGPKMPLAVKRFQVKDLPAAFSLSDADAMAGAKLSAQRQVVIGARISRSGSATPQRGDWEGFSAPVAPGATQVEILIDRPVP